MKQKFAGPAKEKPSRISLFFFFFIRCSIGCLSWYLTASFFFFFKAHSLSWELDAACPFSVLIKECEKCSQVRWSTNTETFYGLTSTGSLFVFQAWVILCVWWTHVGVSSPFFEWPLLWFIKMVWRSYCQYLQQSILATVEQPRCKKLIIIIIKKSTFVRLWPQQFTKLEMEPIYFTSSCATVHCLLCPFLFVSVHHPWSYCDSCRGMPRSRHLALPVKIIGILMFQQHLLRVA